MSLRLFDKSMRMLFISIVGSLTLLLTSCTQKVTFDVTMVVTPKEVRNGEEITIGFVEGEDSNVDFKAEVFWEDVKIGEVSKAPYQMIYVVNGVKEGFYPVRCIITYGEEKGTTSSVGVMKQSVFKNVTE